MPESPDFDQIARRSLDHVIAVSVGCSSVAVIAEQLRRIWNARGAADRKALDEEMLRVKALIDTDTEGDLVVDAERVLTALDR